MEKNNNRRNRSVLKSYFQKGDVPTEQQFAELIDSVSNIVEDGQVMRTPSVDGRFSLDKPVTWISGFTRKNLSQKWIYPHGLSLSHPKRS